MKFKNIGIILLILGFLFAIAYFVRTNSKSAIEYETTNPFISSIELTSVVTGKVIPEDEVEIKPQLNGIIEKILVEEGDTVQNGQLIAVIKVVPDERSVYGAQAQVTSSKLNLENGEKQLNRAKELFAKQIISQQEFEDAELRYNSAKENLKAAENDLEIIMNGSVAGSSTANTNIRATLSGTILEIPVEVGDQVIAANNFNAGTSVAIIADLSQMIFEGKVDESEVDKIRVGTNLQVSLGAVPDQTFDASLRFIAPKGSEEQGTVQFKIEADVFLPADFTVRAGYSANASLVLQEKDSVPAIREALLQFDNKTQEPYVEVQTAEQTFERRDLTLGISDGINVEIVEGLEESDLIKVWNKTEEPDKLDENEE
jgi:HlyD family secretion protein